MQKREEEEKTPIDLRKKEKREANQDGNKRAQVFAH